MKNRYAFPLRITAHLQTPVVSDATLPIDGILYYAIHRDRYGGQEVTVSGSHAVSTLSHTDMPLAVCNEDQFTWFYAASFAHWSTPVATGMDHWNKRFDQRYSDMIDFGKQKGRVIVEAGTYKAYHMPVFTRHARTVTWYVRGDGERIAALLAHMTHLGKKTSQGYGSVLRWDVDPWHADWSVYDEGGRLMRALPANEGIFTGYRPSYWLSSNQTLCRIPEEYLA